MAETFPTGDAYIPHQGSFKEREYRTRSVGFRNATQSVSDGGANSIVERYNLRWIAIPKATSDAIVAFLDARGGFDWFFWSPPLPMDTTQIKVRAEEPVRQTPVRGGDFITVSATFVKVNDQT
jgi:phage-related protein